MATKAEIILDTRRETSKGYPIKIRIYNDGRKYLSLKEYSSIEHWGDNGLLKSHPDYRRLKKKLLDREFQLVREVDYCNENNLGLIESFELIKNGIDDRETRILQLKKELRSLEGDNEAMLFEFWDLFIKERISQKKSIKAFVDTKQQLKDFMLVDDMAINDINYEFLNEFSNYKYANDCGTGGVSFYLRTLRTVYLAAQKRESLGIKSVNPFKGLINESVSKDPVEMTVDEMKKWKNFTPHKFTRESAAKKMIKKRDMWLFQFYIGGHDFVDIALLEWKKNIRNGRIRFKRYKNRRHPNGGPTIDNVLTPMAMEIIKKHGTPYRDRVFSFIPHPNDKESYSHYINNTRRALKKISEDLELKDRMNTKSTRYIFKTWGDQLQIHEGTIKQIQGHSKQGVSSRYGARLPDRVVDRVMKKIITRKK
ncbi:phage integrase SAM-like domain-containing protein [Muricauda sp. MAR_2010_75]|uniref:phage integrase SAM-like domain-containing protein n=1 Tax=Allomuricauda sp. MAR_2010_75 TaxID=1250232 RepID=UPI000567A96C|nr:phage integrase SAM-like domain-containing protein [Muricauda sp. MAR_2010_75]